MSMWRKVLKSKNKGILRESKTEQKGLSVRKLSGLSVRTLPDRTFAVCGCISVEEVSVNRDV